MMQRLLSLMGLGTRRHVLCMLALLPAFAGIHYLAMWLRFDGEIPTAIHTLIYSTMLPVVMIKCVMFGVFRVYRGWSRHVTFQDLLMLAKAATASTLVVCLAGYWHLMPMMPRSVVLLDWGATIVLIGGARGSFRFLAESRRLGSSGRGTPVLIVGVSSSAEALVRALRLDDSKYHVVGLVANSDRHTSTYIGGVPVVGAVRNLRQLVREYGAREVLIASGDLPGRRIRIVADECNRANIPVRVLPSYHELLCGNLAVQPRPVSIVDLLQRDPVELDLNEIRQWIDGRVVMVTGSAGSIGSEVCRQLLRFSPKQLILLDRSENGQFYLQREFAALATDARVEFCIADINDQERMQRLFMRHRPEIVFHAAAYKHVPLMEANPGEAVKNTVLATYRLATMAHDFHVQSFVMISTDKAVNPTNVMGACKRVAELYVQSLAEQSDTRFVTVRFGNVLDSAGSVVPIFRDQIARGGPVTVTDPRIERFFMTIPEAAQLVIQAGTMGHGGEIFILDMGEPVKIVDLAAEMIRLSGLRVGEDIEIQFVGLRPGEKLYEELHVHGEKHLPTRHSKITVAERMPHDCNAIRHAIERLGEIAEESIETVVDELRLIVPQYQPSGKATAKTPDTKRRAA